MVGLAGNTNKGIFFKKYVCLYRYVYVYMYACVYIYQKNIWGIGNDADNYIDGTNILSAILS